MGIVHFILRKTKWFFIYLGRDFKRAAIKRANRKARRHIRRSVKRDLKRAYAEVKSLRSILRKEYDGIDGVNATLYKVASKDYAMTKKHGIMEIGDNYVKIGKKTVTFDLINPAASARLLVPVVLERDSIEECEALSETKFKEFCDSKSANKNQFFKFDRNGNIAVYLRYKGNQTKKVYEIHEVVPGEVTVKRMARNADGGNTVKKYTNLTQPLDSYFKMEF